MTPVGNSHNHIPQNIGLNYAQRNKCNLNINWLRILLCIEVVLMHVIEVYGVDV